MDKVMKAMYIFMIAIVVFLGGLLISQGLSQSDHQTMIEMSEGSAL